MLLLLLNFYQWPNGKKNVQLLIVTLAAITPNFYIAIGIAGVFDIAKTFNVSADKVTSLTTSCVNLFLNFYLE